MAAASYPQAVAMAALQAFTSGAWIAAGELSPARRRLTRFGTVAAMTAVAWAVSPKVAGTDDEIGLSDRPFAVTDPPDAEAETVEEAGGEAPAPAFDKRILLVTAAVLGGSVAMIAGRRRMEKRWLARLAGNGHPHPTRGLAVRMAAVDFAGGLALQLAERHRPDPQGGSGRR